MHRQGGAPTGSLLRVTPRSRPEPLGRPLVFHRFLRAAWTLRVDFSERVSGERWPLRGCVCRASLPFCSGSRIQLLGWRKRGPGPEWRGPSLFPLARPAPEGPRAAGHLPASRLASAAPLSLYTLRGRLTRAHPCGPDLSWLSSCPLVAASPPPGPSAWPRTHQPRPSIPSCCSAVGRTWAGSLRGNGKTPGHRIRRSDHTSRQFPGSGGRWRPHGLALADTSLPPSALPRSPGRKPRGGGLPDGEGEATEGSLRSTALGGRRGRGAAGCECPWRGRPQPSKDPENAEGTSTAEGGSRGDSGRRAGLAAPSQMSYVTRVCMCAHGVGGWTRGRQGRGERCGGAVTCDLRTGMHILVPSSFPVLAAPLRGQ